MKTPGRSRARAAVVLWLLLAMLVSLSPAGAQPLDWQRARELHRREQKGEALTSDERAYLERARSERRQRPAANISVQSKETTGLVPVTEMGERQYKGQTGGLYGGGQNTPPDAHFKAAHEQTSLIQPLDANGVPSATGKVVLISLGMSNTTQEFSIFKKLADADPNKSPRLVIVDCAQGGQAAYQWAYPAEGDSKKPSPWLVMDERIQRAGVTVAQVQVVWMKQAEISPAQYGAFPAHAQTLRDNMRVILHMLKTRFPNLRVAYLSSRIYAGYATTQLNPEPYAYESAFSVRWLIEAQINNDPNLNYDAAKGPVLAPLLLWGPYLWADGTTPRQSDGMVWLREDLSGDGTHPSTSGRQKVAQMLLAFFKTDANAKRWFLKQPTPGQL